MVTILNDDIGGAVDTLRCVKTFLLHSLNRQKSPKIHPFGKKKRKKQEFAGPQNGMLHKGS